MIHVVQLTQIDMIDVDLIEFRGDNHENFTVQIEAFKTLMHVVGRENKINLIKIVRGLAQSDTNGVRAIVSLKLAKAAVEYMIARFPRETL